MRSDAPPSVVPHRDQRLYPNQLESAKQNKGGNQSFFKHLQFFFIKAALLKSTIAQSISYMGDHLSFHQRSEFLGGIRCRRKNEIKLVLQ
jgi:hypothetical protein